MVPFVATRKSFNNFMVAGRRLASMHLGYESYGDLGRYGINVSDTGTNFRVDQMTFKNKKDKSVILYNRNISISGIPQVAYRYRLNGRSAIEWVMEYYRVKIDKDSQIMQDPNKWAKEMMNPRYILDVLLGVINTSIKTMEIVDNLPDDVLANPKYS